MLRAMVSKELRELLPVAAFAVVVYLWLGFGQPASPPWPLQVLPIWGRAEDFPFLSGEFLGSFAVVSGVFAVALGLRQTVSESARGTWLLLLHRPAGRCRLVGMKLVVGAAVYLACAAAAILLYAWWAATPGTHASPFQWWMTAPVWQLGISMVVVYFGGFLSGIRPGRWIGTRLLPLAAAGLLVFFIQAAPQWWPLGLAAVALSAALLAVLIFFVASERDY